MTQTLVMVGTSASSSKKLLEHNAVDRGLFVKGGFVGFVGEQNVALFDCIALFLVPGRSGYSFRP